MLSYCINEKNTKSVNLRVSRTSNGRTMFLSNLAMCNRLGELIRY